MNSNRFITPFKVGLLVIVAVAGTLFMLVTLSGEGGLFEEEDGYVVYALFDDVTGLATRSRVMMAGIPIGHIESIQLEGTRARVDIAITRDLELYEGIKQPDGWYKNGATVIKKQASLIGDFYLEITPGTTGEVIEPGGEIENVVGITGPAELFEKFDQITSDIREVTKSMAAVFGGPEGRENIQQMVNDLQAILQTLRTFVDENALRINDVVVNAQHISRDIEEFVVRGTDTLEEMLADAQTVVQEVKYIIGQSSGDVQAGLGTLRGTLSRLQSTLDSLNYSLQNVQDITDKINEGEGTVGQLVNDPTIAERTEQILTDAGDLVGRVSSLKTIIELRTEYHLEQEAVKNIFGLRLQPAIDKYYLVELVDDVRGKTQVLRRDVVTSDAAELDPAYRETVATTTDDLKFSAQIARGVIVSPWLAAYGRVGIIESTGGGGVNVLLTEGYDLELQADMYEFGSALNPRFRAMANYKVLEWAYISGGIDDALNSDRRDYFIGAGLRFEDEDLKALITTTGVPAP